MCVSLKDVLCLLKGARKGKKKRLQFESCCRFNAFFSTNMLVFGILLKKTHTDAGIVVVIV